MLAATYRLRRSNEFAAAVRGGRRAGRGSLVVHLIDPRLTETDQRPPAHPTPARAETHAGPTVRAGFVVSKSVGGAVVRNQVRRRLRHLVAERLANLPPGATLVVRALPSSASSPYRRLGADLDAAIAAARGPRAGRGSRRHG